MHTDSGKIPIAPSREGDLTSAQWPHIIYEKILVFFLFSKCKIRKHVV